MIAELFTSKEVEILEQKTVIHLVQDRNQENMNGMEINSVIERVGHNSKIIFCGDFRQTDLYKNNDKSGMKKFIQIAEDMPSFGTVEFGPEDIVRSELVKEYILARVKYEEKHE